MYEVKSHHISFVTQTSEICKFASQSKYTRKMDLMMKMKTFARWQPKTIYYLADDDGDVDGVDDVGVKNCDIYY